MAPAPSHRPAHGPLRTGLARLALGAILGLWAAAAWAQSPEGATIGQAEPPSAPQTGPCVAVDIAGQRAGYTECAAARLQAAALTAQAQAKDDPTLAVPSAASPATTTGLASLTASTQRLGLDLRTATSLPQRPAPAPPTTPFPRRP